MTTGSIKEKAKDLLENIPNLNAFFTFANMPKTPSQDRENIYPTQIPDKKRQPSAARQCVICDFHFTYRPRAIILIHVFLPHLKGDAVLFSDGYYKPLTHHPLFFFQALMNK
jgi:hypothetical protein